MDMYMGTILAWAPNFAPQGTLFCQGQLLQIAQYQAMFSLLGTMYGGNGIQTFALPDLRGRAPFGAGQGAGLPLINQGQVGGTASVTLTVGQMPTHTHPASPSGLTSSIPASTGNATATAPTATSNLAAFTGSIPDGTPVAGKMYGTGPNVNMPGGPVTGNIGIGPSGGNQPVGIMPPYLGIQYIIIMDGIYPPRP